MTVEVLSIPVDAKAGGLDRGRIDASGRVDFVSLHSDRKSSASKSISDGDPSSLVDTVHHDDNARTSKRPRLLQKAKEILHIAPRKKDSIPTVSVLADAGEIVSGSRLVSAQPEPETHTAKEILCHPVSTAVSMVTGQGGHQIASNLVAKEISHGNDVEIIRAYDEVKKPGTGSQVKERESSLETLIKERQAMFVKWTIDRHVTTVRVLPVRTEPIRSRNEFKAESQDGKERMDWQGWIRHSAKYSAGLYGSRYIGSYSSPPTPSKETMMPSIERLLVVTAPLQSLTMSVRRIYRWENVHETLKYLFIYSALWIFNIVFPGFLAAIIYFVLHRRIHPQTIEDLRKDIKQVEDLTETALTLSDFIEKTGDENWVDALTNEVGPWTMIQLADMANLAEVLTNFYEWRIPSQTARTLCLMTLGLFAITFVPVNLLLRLFTFACGFIFFGLFPIGSRFPEYRLLVSPVKWLFWNFPTHAEWAILTLQAEGQRHPSQVSASEATIKPLLASNSARYSSPPLAERLSHSPSAVSECGTDDYGAYSCSYDNMHGKMILNSHGAYFVSSIGHKKHFDLPYESIRRLEKVMRPVSKGIGKLLNNISGEDLKISALGEVDYLLSNMKDRDQAFSQIVGFSKVRWQVVW